MSGLVGILDVVAFIGFGASTIMALRWSSARKRPIGVVGAIFAAAMGLYAFVSLSNALEHLNVTPALDPLEDYVELLFVPLIAYVAHAWSSEFQRSKLQHANELIRGEHDLLSRIIENSPVGILLTDDRGHITFANDEAKEVLGLDDPDGRALYETPAWRIRETNAPAAQAPEAGRFKINGSADGPLEGVLCSLEWPDGSRRLLSVNVRPLSEERQTEAYVVALEDVTYRRGLPDGA